MSTTPSEDSSDLTETVMTKLQDINKHVEKKVAKLDNLIESLQLFRKELLKCKVKPKQY